MYSCGGQSLMSDVFLGGFLIFLRQELSVNLELMD